MSAEAAEWITVCGSCHDGDCEDCEMSLCECDWGPHPIRDEDASES